MVILTQSRHHDFSIFQSQSTSFTNSSKDPWGQSTDATSRTWSQEDKDQSHQNHQRRTVVGPKNLCPSVCIPTNLWFLVILWHIWVGKKDQRISEVGLKPNISQRIEKVQSTELKDVERPFLFERHPKTKSKDPERDPPNKTIETNATIHVSHAALLAKHDWHEVIQRNGDITLRWNGAQASPAWSNSFLARLADVLWLRLIWWFLFVCQWMVRDMVIIVLHGFLSMFFAPQCLFQFLFRIRLSGTLVMDLAVMDSDNKMQSRIDGHVSVDQLWSDWLQH